MKVVDQLLFGWCDAPPQLLAQEWCTQNVTSTGNEPLIISIPGLACYLHTHTHFRCVHIILFRMITCCWFRRPNTRILVKAYIVWISTSMGLKPHKTLCSLGRVLYQLSYQGSSAGKVPPEKANPKPPLPTGRSVFVPHYCGEAVPRGNACFPSAACVHM